MRTMLQAPGLDEPFTLAQVSPDEIPKWYHVFSTKKYPATNAHTFSKGWGDTRFAPILQSDGSPVDTYYIASTPATAYMESVLHDVPLTPPGVFELESLRHFHIATIELQTLTFVSFHSPFLPQLGLSRQQLIDSLPVDYPQTRQWAQAAYLQRPDAQAVGYGSRRNDEGRCLMLFGQRMNKPPFRVIATESLAVDPRRREVLGLVQALNLHQM